jgi:hypothetical protein
MTNGVVRRCSQTRCLPGSLAPRPVCRTRAGHFLETEGSLENLKKYMIYMKSVGRCCIIRHRAIHGCHRMDSKWPQTQETPPTQ